MDLLKKAFEDYYKNGYRYVGEVKDEKQGVRIVALYNSNIDKTKFLIDSEGELISFNFDYNSFIKEVVKCEKS